MSIAFGSINTGLPKDIVQQLVKVEEIPITRMEARKEKVESKKKLLTDLSKRVEDLKGEVAKNRGMRSFRELSVDAETDAVKVVLDKNQAVPGSWQFEVMSLAKKSSVYTNGVEDKDKTYTGVGYISYALPDGSSRKIFVGSENANLTGIAKIINTNSEMGVKASVVNDGKSKDEPWRLVLALDKAGDAYKATWPDFYFVDGVTDLYIEDQREGVDAKVRIDGFEMELPENKIKDVIPGAVVDLKKAKPGEEFTITVKEDTVKITEKMTTIVDKINSVLAFIKEQNSLTEKSDTSRTLGGDSTLTQLEGRLRNVIFTPVSTSSGMKRIGDLGVTFTREGILGFDATNFEKALSADYRAASEIVIGQYRPDGTKTDGFLDNMSTMVDQLLAKPWGAISGRSKGLQTNIDQIDRQIENKRRMVEQKQRILQDKFSRLEETMSRIKGQGAGLAGLQGAAMPGSQQLG